MRTKSLISTAALVIAMSVASPLPAQSQQLSIGGTPVPADQLDAVQAKCDELFAQNQAVAIAPPDAPAAEAPVGSMALDADAASATAEADTPVGGMALDSNPAAAIDVAAITVGLCEEGGFTATP